MKDSPILIIGKNGKTGLRVEQRLQALGYATRGVSRSTSAAFDWEDQGSWPAAMAGIRSAYVTFHPDLASPTAEQTIRDFVALAAELGLEHLVLLSGRGEDGARRAEVGLQQGGLDWTIVRSSWFMQNFSENFMIEGILNGELSECVAAISEATGYPVQYAQIPIEDFIDALRGQCAPESLLWLMHELFTVVFDGRNSKPTTGVEEALGRPATDFSEYLRKVMATGAWDRSGMQQQA